MKVKKILEEKGVWFRLIDVPDHKDYDNFKACINEDVEEIVKTIIIKVKDDFKAFCVKKDQLVDYKKLREIFGTKKLRMANAEEVLEHSTCVPGACCPLLVDCEIFFDPSIKELGKIHIGSGSLKHGLDVEAKDLIAIVNPKFLEVGIEK